MFVKNGKFMKNIFFPKPLGVLTPLTMTLFYSTLRTLRFS